MSEKKTMKLSLARAMMVAVGFTQGTNWKPEFLLGKMKKLGAVTSLEDPAKALTDPKLEKARSNILKANEAGEDYDLIDDETEAAAASEAVTTADEPTKVTPAPEGAPEAAAKPKKDKPIKAVKEPKPAKAPKPAKEPKTAKAAKPAKEPKSAKEKKPKKSVKPNVTKKADDDNWADPPALSPGAPTAKVREKKTAAPPKPKKTKAPELCGILIRKHGLAAGITQPLVNEFIATYAWRGEYKPNDIHPLHDLRAAWGILRGYTRDEITDAPGVNARVETRPMLAGKLIAHLGDKFEMDKAIAMLDKKYGKANPAISKSTLRQAEAVIRGYNGGAN